ncbi:methionine synthase [Nocardioides marmoriginsengisoli]|uniref:Methionine synthase n=2 Tax=Nocardioides marmoriginsengisoli TaxID=661483 RepID=A0A3N0CR59_9ACTN|nr:methionine synthase [Nocardioides marmoriginsengisoli]
MPGEDYAEAVRISFGEVPDLPFLPELPDRGVTAGMTGRTLAMVTDLGFDLQPAGWRLTDASGVDHRRARSLLAHDLDVLEEHAQDYAGELKVQVCGPWTLAATVERPRGDRLLADAGARRELGEALAEGLEAHLADLRRRVAGARLVVQVDEPALSAVLAAQVPTSSGFGRHRSVDPAGASAGLEPVFAAIERAGAQSIAHCCASNAPVALLRGAGAGGVSIDLDVLAAEGYDELGSAFDEGARVFLGVVPSVQPPVIPTERQVAERVLRLLDMLGFDPEEVGAQLVVSPSCGLAGASPEYARTALTLVRDSAVRLRGD